jgi:prepilin-type N-terminal cleavage/methylation domain-containing protein
MKLNQGFSLIELVIVLIVIGLLIGGLLPPLSVQFEQQNIKLTNQRLQEIKEALVGYAILDEDRELPCPTGDEGGKLPEPPNDKNYCNKEGYLPWVDLGIIGHDGWGNIFRYRVDNEFKNLQISTIKWANEPEHWVSLKNDTHVRAIIYSCGKNGRPDPTPSLSGNSLPEIDYNFSNDTNRTRNSDMKCRLEGTKTRKQYVYNSYVDNVFDDQVTWLSEKILITRLTRARKWPAD